MEHWVESLISADVVPHAFKQGHSFLGCSTKQKRLQETIERAKAKSAAAYALEGLNRSLKKASRIEKQQAVADYMTSRGLARTEALEAMDERWCDRWDQLLDAANVQEEEATTTSAAPQNADKFKGLTKFGLKAHYCRPVDMGATTTKYDSATKHAMGDAAMFMVDLRTEEDPEQALEQSLQWIT